MVTFRRLHRFVVALIMATFLLWGAYFVYSTSFLGIDGKRYFSLFDDAMVSMRYAWNLSHGLGLVWNEGVRVEGYTNLLMVLIMSVSTALLDKRLAVLSIQVFGIATMLAIGYLAMMVGEIIAGDRKSARARYVGLACLVCVLAYYPLAYWTLMGMETGLVTALMLGSLVFALDFRKARPKWHSLAIASLLGLAYLARPDTIVLSVPLLAVYTIKLLRDPLDPQRGRWAAGFLALFLFFPIGQSLFRLGYYGQLLPNTYVLKMTGVPLAERIHNGIVFVGPFLKEILPLLILAGVAILIDATPPKLLIAAIVAAGLGYQIWAGGDAWNYWRLVSPVVPLLLVLFWTEMAAVASLLTELSQSHSMHSYWTRRPLLSAIEGVATSSRRVQRYVAPAIAAIGAILIAVALLADPLGLGKERGLGEKAIIAVALGLLLVFVGSQRMLGQLLTSGSKWLGLGALFVTAAILISIVDRRFLPQMTFSERPFQVGDNESNVNIAIALDQITSPEASIGVVWAGSIPYYTGRPAVDFLGKSDLYIASLEPDLSGRLAQLGMTTLPGHNKYDLDYSIKVLRPTYIQRCSWGLQDICGWATGNYAEVQHRGVDLDLLNGSEDVMWGKLAAFP